MFHRDLEISLIESVWDVPTDRSKLGPLLDACVQKTQAVYHAHPDPLWLGGGVGWVVVLAGWWWCWLGVGVGWVVVVLVG